VLVLDSGQPPGGIFDRFIPLDFHPFIVVAFLGGVFAHSLQGFLQAIRAGVDILNTSGLGADIALAEDVILVPADGEDLFAIVLNLYAAHGFAKVAGSVMKLAHS
jgi:hypothetical protein